MFETLENRQHMSGTLLTPSIRIPPPTTTTTAVKVELQHEETHVKEVVPFPSDWQGWLPIYRRRL